MTSDVGGVERLSSTTRRGEDVKKRSEAPGSLVRMLRLSDRAGFSLTAPVAVIFWWYLSIMRRMLGAVVRTTAVRICTSAWESSASSDDLVLSYFSDSPTRSHLW